MTTLLLFLGLFFVVGWTVAIILAIRKDWHEYRQRKVNTPRIERG